MEAILVISSFIIRPSSRALFLLFYKTKFGIALRASMENPALAEIMGVNVENTRLFSWFLSGSLAAVAGSLLPFRQEIVPFSRNDNNSFNFCSKRCGRPEKHYWYPGWRLYNRNFGIPCYLLSFKNPGIRSAGVQQSSFPACAYNSSNICSEGNCRIEHMEKLEE